MAHYLREGGDIEKGVVILVSVFWFKYFDSSFYCFIDFDVILFVLCSAPKP